TAFSSSRKVCPTAGPESPMASRSRPFTASCRRDTQAPSTSSWSRMHSALSISPCRKRY
ncbi:hypothetical protein LEFCBN_LEFCBN_09445, partial [Dysosmobacter welbionis]